MHKSQVYNSLSIQLKGAENSVSIPLKTNKGSQIFASKTVYISERLYVSWLIQLQLLCWLAMAVFRRFTNICWLVNPASAPLLVGNGSFASKWCASKDTGV